jgi:hypothetical protein
MKSIKKEHLMNFLKNIIRGDFIYSFRIFLESYLLKKN